VKPLSIALLYGKAASIKLAWKGLPGTNAVAYYDNLEITDKKDIQRWAQRSLFLLENAPEMFFYLPLDPLGILV
jgi:hypothetical protein